MHRGDRRPNLTCHFCPLLGSITQLIANRRNGFLLGFASCNCAFAERLGFQRLLGPEVHCKNRGYARDGGADNEHLKDKLGKTLLRDPVCVLAGLEEQAWGRAGYECFDATSGDEAFGPLQTQYPVGRCAPTTSPRYAFSGIYVTSVVLSAGLTLTVKHLLDQLTFRMSAMREACIPRSGAEAICDRRIKNALDSGTIAASSFLRLLNFCRHHEGKGRDSHLCKERPNFLGLDH